MSVDAEKESYHGKQASASTAVNWKVILLTFTIMFGSALTITMSFPFLPWMVRIFKVNGEFITVEETGYYVGLVATAYFLGRFAGSYFWGVLSDKKGRRPALILSGAGITLFTLLFGFSNTATGLGWALVMRFFSGASNGAVGTAKAVVSDVSDDSNQSKHMVVMTLAFSAGMTVGPALGGALAEPVRQYPGTFEDGDGTIREFLERFPYFLPCFVIAILSGTATLIVYCKLPETSHKKSVYQVLKDEDVVDSHYDKDGKQIGCDSQLLSVHYDVEKENVQINIRAHMQNGSVVKADDSVLEDDGPGILNESCNSSLISKSREKEENEDDEDIALSDCSRAKADSIDASQAKGDSLLVISSSPSSSLGLWTRVRRGSVRLQRASTTALKKSKMWALLKSSEVRKAVFLYCIFSFAVIGGDEIYSLWLSTKPYRGGLGFSERNIGVSLAILSTFMALTQVLFVHKLERKFGSLRVFYAGCIVVVLTVALFPVLASVTNPIVLWTSLIILQVPYRTFVGACFVMTALFINNSVPPTSVGSVNGLAVAATALTRAASPSISGSIYAWSIDSTIGFPFDEHLTFYIFCLVFLASLCSAVRIPEHMSRKKIL
ncbi:uncharacterized protein LOC134182061 [Corticium candelabrum]|uniref:uncharacterized protein LOC134182061 n=1 Tax=Corticium candelabrum TaxID=121492 RepID=UPI002E264E74|nr:uncharacterized protein LOC134182061 [Corticium candelabrum]